MAKKDDRVTTNEFASLTGIPVSKVSKLIREGKIRAKKDLGKWMILKSQLNVKAVKELSSTKNKKKTIKQTAKTGSKKITPKKIKKAGAKKKPVIKTKSKSTLAKKPISSKPKAEPAMKSAAVVEKKNTTPAKGKFYSISEFCQMTYLTEFGITDWLQKGILLGEKESNGQWRVNAESLELSRMKRLIR